jgi:hypothetical protein
MGKDMVGHRSRMVLACDWMDGAREQNQEITLFIQGFGGRNITSIIEFVIKPRTSLDAIIPPGKLKTVDVTSYVDLVA